MDSRSETNGQLEHLDAVAKANGKACPAAEQSTHTIATPVAVVPLGMRLEQKSGWACGRRPAHESATAPRTR